MSSCGHIIDNEGSLHGESTFPLMEEKIVTEDKLENKCIQNNHQINNLKKQRNFLHKYKRELLDGKTTSNKHNSRIQQIIKGQNMKDITSAILLKELRL